MRNRMVQKKTEKLIHNFATGMISDVEAANSWASDAIDAQNVDDCMTHFKSLPTIIRLAVCRVFDEIRQNNFKWSPFVIATDGCEESTLNAEQRSVCEAILKQCNAPPQDTV